MYRWQDLIFDILDPKDRAEYLRKDGTALPVTHESAPLTHSSLCQMLSAGEYGSDLISWSVRARVDLKPDEFQHMEQIEGASTCIVDYGSLESTRTAMLLAVESCTPGPQHVTDRPSKPTAKQPIPYSKAKAKRRK